MNTHRITRIMVGLVLVSIVFGMVAQAALAEEKIKLKRGEEEWLVFRIREESWKVESPNLSIKIQHKGDKFQFNSPTAEYKMKETEEGKYKLYSPDGSLLFKIKVTPEKRKIYQSEDGDATWVIKLKDDGRRFAVLTGPNEELELGQVKFYPDTGKLKAKDTENVEQCVMKTDRLRSAPAVYFFTNLSEEEQLLLFGVLMLID